VTAPPKTATWILRRFATCPDAEVIVGDLLEEYESGQRSRTWYWRQVLVAAGVSVWKDIRDHKLLAVRAVVVGWAFYILFSFPVVGLARFVIDGVTNWLIGTAWYSVWWELWGFFLLSEPLVYSACALSGWLVARLHPTRPIAMVCLYAASIFLFEYAQHLVGLFQHPPIAVPASALVVRTVLVIGRPVSILVGGLSAFSANRSSVTTNV